MKNPLHYQLTEYDCGPTSMLNAVSFLFDREEIPPEMIRNIMIYCLDRYGMDGITGKSGTSHMAMMFLSNWMNGFAQAGHLPVSSRYISGSAVNLGQNSVIRDALRRGGAVVALVDLDGWHYVLLTGIEDDKVKVFDPYYQSGPFGDEPVVIVDDQPFSCNRVVSAGCFEQEELRPYAFGSVEEREAVVLFNRRTELTEEKTVEYII